MTALSTDRVSEIEVSYRPAIGRKPVIRTSLDAFTEFMEHFPEETIALQEHFLVMYLNRANRVLGIYRLSSGGINGTVVDLRLLLGVALKLAATSIVIAHNHPSGNLVPSQSDRDLTQKIQTACKFLDIRLYDHLIISPERKFYSMME